MASSSCDAWYHGECQGTPLCPPRCPRFFDREDHAYIVRPADESDRDGILEMYRDYPAEHRSMGVPPKHETRLEQWLDRLQERGQNFVATRDGDVVGHALYSPTTAAVPEMLVYVDPEYHGRGLGTELTKHVLAFAAESGHDAVSLDVDRDNTTAINVYHELGFERTDETPMEYEMELPTDASIVMQIRLPPAERDV